MTMTHAKVSFFNALFLLLATMQKMAMVEEREIEREEEVTHDGSLDYKARRARRSLTGTWKACSFLICYEIFDKLAHFGISSNLVTYLSIELCEGTSESAKNINILIGTGFMISIIGAFVADAYLGLYRSIAIVSIVYILGLITLTLLEVLKPFKPIQCDHNKNSITTIQVAPIFISLYLIFIGGSITRTSLGTFGANQFDDGDPSEKRKKTSFFNRWSLASSSGALLAFTIVLYIQEKFGWGTFFALITGAVLISSIVFLIGTPFYRSKRPSGSTFTSIAQVLFAAARKWNVKVPDDKLLLYNDYYQESLEGGRRKLLHTEDLRFLDKAATNVSQKKNSELIPTNVEELNTSSTTFNDNVENMDGLKDSGVSRWMLCSVTQVEEVKLIARTIPIWMSSTIFFVPVVQTNTFFTNQGATMDRHITSNFIIPTASLLSVSMLVNLICVPIYDHVFVPTVRWLTGNERGITILQRLGVGMFINIMVMVVAALCERKRLHVAQENDLLDNPNATIPITIFWLLPQYILYGTSFVFGFVGQQEFFYDQMPDTMKSMGMALCYCSFGAGSFLSSILIAIVDNISSKYGSEGSWFVNNLNKCHLDYFYWVIATLSTMNFCIYILLAHSHVNKRLS